MGTFQGSDRNGNAVNFQTDPAVGGNVTPRQSLGDASGNGFLAAPGGEGAQLVSSDGTKATYRYSVTDITPVATPTDVVVIKGSATMTVRIKRIVMAGFATTAGQLLVELIRRSVANTGGSPTVTAVTPGKHDINDPAATAVVDYITAGNCGTLGASAGQMGVGRMFLNVAATGPTTPAVWDFATRQDKAIILRGVTDFLCINCGGATLPSGAALDFECETEEDNS